MLEFLLDAMDNNKDKDLKVDLEFILAMYTGLIFAGTDTSSHIAGMALYNIAQNPSIKVHFLI